MPRDGFHVATLSYVDEDDIERALTATQEYVSQQAAATREPKIVALSERRL